MFLFLARDTSSRYCHDVLSVRPRRRALSYHTVHVSADLSLWLYSQVLSTLTPKHVHPFPALFQFHIEERCGIDVQIRRDISRTAEE